jgi:ATP-binding cassette subfamily B (MDR/TAP) protein 1
VGPVSRKDEKLTSKLSWKLTLILISVVFAMVFSMGAISKLATKFHKNSQEYSGPGATLAEEVFSSIRNATSLGNQERLAQQYDDLLSKAEMWGFRMKSVSGLMLG